MQIWMELSNTWGCVLGGLLLETTKAQLGVEANLCHNSEETLQLVASLGATYGGERQR